MKVSLVVAMSVDGRIAASQDQNSLEWTSKEDKAFFVEKTKEAGVLIMGRTTYETIGRPLPHRLTVVMTRDKSQDESIEGTLEYTMAKPKAILEDLEIRGFKEVIIAGGAQVYSMFLKDRLVTDLYVTIEPILFGSGVSFIDGADMSKLHLEDVKKLNDQAYLLHYTVL